MKVLEKIGLTLFSYLAIIVSVICCLIIFGWLDLEFVHNIIRYSLNDQTISTIVIVVSAIFTLLAIKCIFFNSSDKEFSRQNEGILLENNDGKLMISKETLESLIATVSKGFNGAENVESKVYLDKENNLNVFVTLYVHPNAVIKDLSSNLQTKIKETIKKTSDLDIKEVNIKVKNIAPEKNIVED